MSLLVSAADASAYRNRLKRTSLAGKRRHPLLDTDQRVGFIEKLEIVDTLIGEAAAEAHEMLMPNDAELPGDGQFFCPWCARHFVNEKVLREHELSKTHKKRRKEVLAEGSAMDQQLVSELAVGFSRETKKVRSTQ